MKKTMREKTTDNSFTLLLGN